MSNINVSMNNVESIVEQHLYKKGFRPETKSAPAFECALKFMHINGWTIAWDCYGIAWEHRECVDPGDFFGEMKPEIIPSPHTA